MTLEEHQRELQEMEVGARSRHPNRSSRCGVLLAEILNPASERTRVLASSEYGFAGYQRGYVLIARLATQVANSPEQLDDGKSNDAHNRLWYPLYILARMDTARSHLYLVDLLSTSSSSVVRGYVLEALAHEDAQFDLELVLTWLRPDVKRPELLSVLYALMTHFFASQDPERSTKLVGPFLSHEDVWVRHYAIEALQWYPGNRELIRALLDDPYEPVREQAQRSLDLIDQIESEGLFEDSE